MAFLSGLALGGVAVASLAEARGRLLDFLRRRGQDDPERARLAESVRQVIVCGGTLGVEPDNEGIKAALDEADAFLSELGSVLPVDVMPGRHDPTNLSLPQTALHTHLFRQLRGCTGVKLVGNPYECTMEGLRILGHSGQPVEDLLRCTKLRSPADALELCLEGRHLAPTAPDTLEAQPFQDADPFVIGQAPHILFSGGHARAEQRWRSCASSNSGTLCLCVPAFHRQLSVVLVSMHNPSDVRVVNFGPADQQEQRCSR